MRFCQRHDIRALHAYLAYLVVIRLRISKAVKKTAIRISTPAATARDDVAIPCPLNAKLWFRTCNLSLP